MTDILQAGKFDVQTWHFARDGESISTTKVGDGPILSTTKTSTKTNERSWGNYQKFFRDWNEHFPPGFWMFGVVCLISFMITQPQN